MIDWKRKCAAVIPCYDEAGQIASVVEAVRCHLPVVVVVDDGSTDATEAEAVRAGAQVIRKSANGGKGSALRAGWLQVQRMGFTWALCLDGDGQHAPEDIPMFFGSAERRGAPLVVGNRMGNSTAMPWARRQANRWMTRRLSKLAGVRLADSQCGFRLLHLETLASLPLTANRFEIESETLIAFLSAGHRVEFVPIRVIYNSGKSHIDPLADTWRWLRWWRGALAQ